MVKRSTKLRWRRKFRRGQRQVENISIQTEQGIEEHFFKRLIRLKDVRRFVAGWLTLMVLLGTGVVMQVRALSPYYQTLQPTSGGIYTEGILGTFTTLNPLYATSSVDSSVSKLMFASLMKYNTKNQLVGDLASKVSADERNQVFTITLKDDIYWHDGEPVTPEDVIFTYQMIQNPDAKSPLRSNWQSVTVEKIDDKTLKFSLPHSLSSFEHLLTNGIVPKHRLDRVPPGQLRTAEFNTTAPVGSGPFEWSSIQINGTTPELREEQIGLSANKLYHDGVPNLDKFIVKAIHSKDRLERQFNDKQIDGISGLNKRPEAIPANIDNNEYQVPINAEVMVFLKNTNDILKDKVVRQALTKATDRKEILDSLGYPVIPVQGPLLRSDLGFDKTLTQMPYDEASASALLDQAGWVKDEKGMRSKDGIPLVFQLYSRNSGEYALVSQILQRQWKQVGVDLDVVLQEDAQLQSTIALHAYDALLYGITVGSDPDQYAYWHSSQADARASSRLNFSEYQSKAADSALEGGRTRSDPALRAAKYVPFLKAWQDDAPAIGLYQPPFYYITRGKVYGFHPTVFNTGVDRYANVQNWQIRTQRVNIE